MCNVRRSNLGAGKTPDYVFLLQSWAHIFPHLRLLTSKQSREEGIFVGCHLRHDDFAVRFYRNVLGT